VILLPRVLQAWNSADFEQVLKREIEALDAGLLPLQQGLTHSSYASDEQFHAVILKVEEHLETIEARAAIFYTGRIPGCSCADDPTPDETYAEQCELRFEIDRHSAETRITLLTG
jgi:hypothetical protein